MTFASLLSQIKSMSQVISVVLNIFKYKYVNSIISQNIDINNNKNLHFKTELECNSPKHADTSEIKAKVIQEVLTLPRRVTAMPTVVPSRSLKAAMEFLALVLTGLCPVMTARSFIAASKPLEFCSASPIPQFTTTFSILGT